jgi:hypothetical protein
VLRFIIGWHRSGTFRPHTRVVMGVDMGVTILQTSQVHSCAYVLENVPPLGDFWSVILAAWQQIKAWIREPM